MKRVHSSTIRAARPVADRRARLVLILLFGGFTVLAGRALFLQGLSTEFLQQQGERHMSAR